MHQTAAQSEDRAGNSRPGGPAEVIIHEKSGDDRHDHLQTDLAKGKIAPQFSAIPWFRKHERSSRAATAGPRKNSLSGLRFLVRGYSQTPRRKVNLKFV